ncbi:MAG: cob(I)yrinic acid a,c-diamide adenosyltransferase [Candidatus Sedimenticola sp. (ex Thyasira tokunagai)]
MGYRLSKIYTRTGDGGTTGLGDGSRVEKENPRIETIGCIDELNSLIGLLIAHRPSSEIEVMLTEIQHRLFDLGGELAIPGQKVITDESVDRLEQQLDTLNTDLPPLKEFILPGGNLQAASCHLARAVCRRSERRLTALSRLEGEEVSPITVKYLNRLSDLLFVMARTLARQNGGGEVFWSKPEPIAP